MLENFDFPRRITITSISQSIDIGYFLENDHIKVTRYPPGGGSGNLLVNGVEYNISGAGDESGGTIQMVSESIGNLILIERDMDFIQPANLPVAGKFNEENIEEALDRMTMQIQQIKGEVDSAISLPFDESPNSNNTEIASIGSRANTLLAFDGVGNLTEIPYDGSPADLTNITVSTVSSLRSVEEPSSNTTYLLLGNVTPGDGGGGLFRWSSTSTASENGAGSGTTKASGTVVKLTDTTTGRFLRVYDGGLVNARWFGVDGTSDAAAVQAAIDYCDSMGEVFWLPPGLTANVESGITSDGGSNIKMDGVLNYTGSSNITVFRWGTAGSASPDKNLKLNVTRTNQSDWTSQDNIAIKLINPRRCEIVVAAADKATIGLYLMGDGSGCVYNNFYLTRVLQNQSAILMEKDNSGWCNENTFIGGSLAVSSGINSSSWRTGIRMLPTDATNRFNNNLFLGTSIELANGTSGSTGKPSDGTNNAPGAYLDGAESNRFLHYRSEDTDAFEIVGSSRYNKLEPGYNNETSFEGVLLDSSDYLSNIFTNAAQWPFEYGRKEVFRLENIHEVARNPSGSSTVVPRMFVIDSSTGTISRSQTGFTHNSDYLTIPSTRGIGIRIWTGVTKKFAISYDSEDGAVMKYAAYDSSLTRLTNSDPNHPYVKAPSFIPVSYNPSSFGGTYGTSSTGQHYVAVNDDVEFIDIIWSDTSIRSLTVSTPEARDAAIEMVRAEGPPSVGSPSELTISSGAITATGAFHTVDTESDAGTDDLDTVNGILEGESVLFKPASGARTVVFKDGTGNLTLGSDKTLDDATDCIIITNIGGSLVQTGGNV